MVKSLTIQDCIQKGIQFGEYRPNVYEYEIDGKTTLVEDGKVLVFYAEGVHGYGSGVFEFLIKNKYTLVEDGKVLVKSADSIYGYQKGTYRYEQNGRFTLVEDNKVIIDNVGFCSMKETRILRIQTSAIHGMNNGRLGEGIKN